MSQRIRAIKAVALPRRHKQNSSLQNPGLQRTKINPNHRSVPAVTRAIAALRLLGANDTPMGVNAIATRLKVVPSTALHILRVLVKEELVSFDPKTKGYALDAGILTLARSALQPGNIGSRIQASLEKLAQKHHVTLLASRVVGIDHIIVVASCSSNLPLRLHVEVGNRFPALMSATGRCVAAFQDYPQEEIRRRFEKIRWDAPPTFAKWLREVKEAKRRHYSIDRGNYLAGVTIVASPILDQGGVITHAIVALGLNDKMTPVAIKELSNDLRVLAERFSEKQSV